MKGRKSFSFLTAILAVVMLAGLVGCSPAATQAPAQVTEPTKADAAAPEVKATEAPADTSAAGEQVELRIAWWGSQNRHDRTIKAIELFEQKYPNIKITYEFAGWDDYWTKMTTQAAGANLPDIMQQDYAYLYEWTNKGLLAPLDAYVADGTLDLSDIDENSLTGGYVDGKLYAINLGNNSQTILIDVDAFEQAGMELPSETWTWEEFEQVAMQLTEKLGYPGMSAGLWNDQFFKNIMISNGQQFYADDGTSLGFTDTTLLENHFKMLVRLQDAGAMITREDEVANKYTVETDPIVTQGAAMTYTNSNQIIAIWNAAGLDRNFKTYFIPRVDQPANYFKPSQFFSVTSNSKHPKEAALFINFFTNDLEANKLLMAERGVPIAGKVRDGLKPLLDKSQAEMFDFLTRLEGNVVPIPKPDPAGHPDIVKNVWTPLIVDPILYGQDTPENVMPTLINEANIILAKNKK